MSMRKARETLGETVSRTPLNKPQSASRSRSPDYERSCDPKPLPYLPVHDPKHEGYEKDPTKRPGVFKLTFRCWWRELLACLLILADLVALIVTVTKQRGKPIRAWTLGISLNALIAIYTIILRAAAAFVLSEGLGQLKWTWFRSPRKLADFQSFDKASRGQLWGSVRFIFSFAWRSPWALTGTAVLLATLVSDPFAQELIMYNPCANALPTQNATTIRTSYYDQAGLHRGADSDLIPFDMQIAINKGAFGGLGDFKVMPTCPSGNCTFPPYHTLGYCTSCHDISDQIEFVNLTVDERAANLIDVKAFNLYHVVSGSTVGTATSMSTATSPTTVASTFTGGWTGPTSYPNGTQVFAEAGYYKLQNKTTSVSYNASAENGGSYPTYMQIASDDGRNFTLIAGFLQGTPNSRESFKAYPTPHCDATTESSWPCQGQGAASCSLSLCVKTLSTNVTAGNLQENTIGSISIPGENHTLADSRCIQRKHTPSDASAILAAGKLMTPNPYSDDDNTTWLGYTNNWPTTPANLVYPFNLTSDDIPGGTLPQGGLTIDPSCTYGMSQINIVSFPYYLLDFLAANLTTKSGGYPFVPALAQIGANPTLNQFFRGGNLTFDSVQDIFQGIANSITEQIRRDGNSAGFSDAAQGVIWQSETCIELRWAWLSYPAILAFLVIAFLVGTMVESAIYRQGDWKTSMLPVLFHGLREPPVDEVTGRDADAGEGEILVKPKAMEKMAANMHVQLAESDEGWKLIDSSPREKT